MSVMVFIGFFVCFLFVSFCIFYVVSMSLEGVYLEMRVAFDMFINSNTLSLKIVYI